MAETSPFFGLQFSLSLSIYEKQSPMQMKQTIAGLTSHALTRPLVLMIPKAIPYPFRWNARIQVPANIPTIGWKK